MYVDTKLPEIAQIRKERYDANAQAYDQLQQKISSIRLNPGDEHLKTRLQADIDKQMAGNIGFEGMDRTIAAIGNRLASDTLLLDSLDNYQTRRKELETVNALRSKGNDPVRFDLRHQFNSDGSVMLDPNTGLPAMQPVADTWVSESDGAYNARVEERKNIMPDLETITRGIASKPIVLQTAKNKNLDPATAAMYVMSGDYVSEDQVYSLADNMADVFINSESGNQMFRELTQLKVNPATGKLYTELEAKAYLSKLVFDHSSKQVGGKYNYDVNAYMKWALENQPTTEPSSPDIVETYNLGEQMESMSEYNPVKDDGAPQDWLTQVVKGNDHYDFDPYTGMIGDGTGVNITASVKRVKDELKKFNGNFAELARKNPDVFNSEKFKKSVVHYILNDKEGIGWLKNTKEFKDMSKEEYAKAVLKSLVSTSKTNAVTFPPEGKDMLVNSITGEMLTAGTLTFGDKEFDAKDQKGLETFFDNNDLIDLTGISEDWSPTDPSEYAIFKQLLNTVSYSDGKGVLKLGDKEFNVGMTPRLHFTGKDAGKLQFNLEIATNDKPIQFSYEFTEEQAKGFKLIQEIYKNIDKKDLSASNTPVKIVDKTLAKELFGDEKEYAYIVRPTKEGEYKPFFYQKSEDGKWSPLLNESTGQPMSMDVITRAAEIAVNKMKTQSGRLIAEALRNQRQIRTTFE